MGRETPTRRFALIALGMLAWAVVALHTALPAWAAPSDWTDPAPASPPTRVLPWTGGEHLSVRVDAYVRYVQGPDARVAIFASRDLADRIVVDGGVIRYEDWGWWGSPWWWGSSDRVLIVVTAPHLSDVRLGGSGRLDLGRLAQDRLDLSVSGSGRATAAGAVRALSVRVSGSGGATLTGLTTTAMETTISGSGRVIASGTAGSLHLRISGSGGADLSQLVLDDVEARLSGSGSARVAPKRSADLQVSGSGGVRLLTEPARLTMRQSGSGRIVRARSGG